MILSKANYEERERTLYRCRYSTYANGKTYYIYFIVFNAKYLHGRVEIGTLDLHCQQ